MSANVAFCVLLLFALYGIAGLLRRLTILILRPEKPPRTFSLAYLNHDTQNVEQIIRYFRTKAEREDVLFLIDNGVSEAEKTILEKMCAEQSDVRFITAENFVEENCIRTGNAV